METAKLETAEDKTKKKGKPTFFFAKFSNFLCYFRCWKCGTLCAPCQSSPDLYTSGVCDYEIQQWYFRSHEVKKGCQGRSAIDMKTKTTPFRLFSYPLPQSMFFIKYLEVSFSVLLHFISNSSIEKVHQIVHPSITPRRSVVLVRRVPSGLHNVIGLSTTALVGAVGRLRHRLVIQTSQMSYCHESAPNRNPQNAGGSVSTLRRCFRKMRVDEKCVQGEWIKVLIFANGFKWIDHPSLHIGSCRKTHWKPPLVRFCFHLLFYSAAFVLSGCGAVGRRPCLISHQKCFLFCEFSQRYRQSESCTESTLTP